MSHAKQLHNRRYLNDYLEIINRAGLPGNVKNDVCRKVQATVIATVQHVIEAALDEELSAYLGVERYEHVPWGRPPEATRSGSYQRTLLTQYGAIADLHVPKLRRGNGALTWQSIMRYECCWGPLLDHQVMSYCLGHSLRDLQETLALTLGEVLSLAACNRMVSRVTEQLAVFKMQALESPPPVLLVDGMWGKIAYPTGEYRHDAQGRRRSVKRKQKRVVLSALGVWPDGHWEIVPWKVAEGERVDPWKAFFGELYLKGITEATTALVVSDGANGLESALDHHLYGVAHQRCIFHKIKQLADHLVFGELPVEPSGDAAQATRQAKRQRKKALLADASQVYKVQARLTSGSGPQGSRTRGKGANRRQWRTFLSILRRPYRTWRSICPSRSPLSYGRRTCGNAFIRRCGANNGTSGCFRASKAVKRSGICS